MYIGLVIYEGLDTVSGSYLYDRKLVEAFKAQGDPVEVLTLPWRNYFRHLTDNLSPLLLAWLRAVEFDVLLQDELNHPSLFWLNEQARGAVDYPIVSIVHHLRSSEARGRWWRLDRRVERRYLRSVDAYIFSSGATRAAVEALTGEEKPCIVAYPAGDRFGEAPPPERIAARAEQGGALRIVFLDSIIERKGLHMLVDALAELDDVDWRLAVIGSPEVEPRYVERLHAQVEYRGLAGRVEWAGQLTDDEVVERLSRADVLAVPSSHEGFGIVYLEGMAFGLPAIGPTGGGAAEIITHGENGFLVEPGDVEALARHLRTLAQDRARLRSMSLAARQRYEAHPTWQETGERVRAFLQQLVEELQR